MRTALIGLLSLYLSGCAGITTMIAGPDPETYLPQTAWVMDYPTYQNDVKMCRMIALNGHSAFSAGAVVVAGGRAAIYSAPAALASPPLYGVDVGAAVGSTVVSEATGSREPKLRAFVSCVRQATTEDKSAVLADQN